MRKIRINLSEELVKLLNNELTLIIFLVLLLFFKLGEMPLQEMDDITHAAIGKSILIKNDWFTMHEGNEISFLKPPLYFWIEAIFFKLFGVSDYFARLPSAISGFLLLFLMYKITKNIINERVAFLSVLLLCLSSFFVHNSRRAMLDIPVTMSLCLGIYSFIKAEFYGEKKFYILMAIAISMGYYFKAIQGLYLIGIIPLYFIFTRQYNKLFNKWFLVSIFLSFFIIMFWAYPQYLKYGNNFLYSQCALGPLFYGGLPGRKGYWYNPFIKLFGVFWATPLSLFGIWLLFKNKINIDKRFNYLLLSWIIVTMIILAKSNTFYLRYLLPVFPPFAIFAGIFLNYNLKSDKYEKIKAYTLSCLYFLILLIIITPISIDSSGTKYFQMYNVIKSVVENDRKIILYKDKFYRFNQGLVYYSNRILEEQILNLSDLEKFKKEKVCVIVTNKDFEYFDKRDNLKLIAFSKDWRLYFIN